MDSMDHGCLMKTKAAQCRAILLELHWNIPRQRDDISGNTGYSWKIRVTLTPRKEKGQSSLCLILQSAKNQRRLDNGFVFPPKDTRNNSFIKYFEKVVKR